MHDLNTFLKQLIDEGGSDLHILSGDPIRIRKNGDLTYVTEEPISAKDTLEMLKDIMTTRNQEVLENDEQVDFAHEVKGIGRFCAGID